MDQNSVSKTKETPLYTITTSDIRKLYSFCYEFCENYSRIHEGKPTKITTMLIKNPSVGAAELLYLVLYGYSKKRKFSKTRTYLHWKSIPKTAEGRLKALIGSDNKAARRIIKETIAETGVDKVPIRFGSDTQQPTENTSTAFVPGFFDEQSFNARMQRYTNDFDLHSAVDQDVLRNLVKTQILIEQEHDLRLSGKSMLNDAALKSLSEQLKNYITILGLSKKERADSGLERQQGSVAELAQVYEETLQTYLDVEEEFFREELEMLLEKFERRTIDGDRELDAITFKIISGGVTVEKAREIVGVKRKYAKKPKYTPDS